jgi:hypothetical protein
MRRWFGLALALTVSACAGSEGSKVPTAPIEWGSLDGGTTSTEWGTGPRERMPGGTPMTDLQLAAVKKLGEFFYVAEPTEQPKLLKDPAPLAALYAADATLSIAGVVDAKGKDAIVKAYQDVVGPFSPFRMMPAHIYLKGSTVTVHWTTNGAQSRDWMGFKADPSPDPIGYNLISAYEFTPEGLIKAQRDHFDPFVVVLQIGEGPKGMDKPWRPSHEVTPYISISTGTAVEQQNAEIPKKMSEAETKKNLDDYLGFLDPEVLHTGPLGTTKGRDAEKRSLTRLFSAFDGLEVQDVVTAVDDTVVDEFTESGTMVGALDPWKATKKKATWHGVELYKMAGGKVVQLLVVTNRAEVLDQLGLFKFPKAK